MKDGSSSSSDDQSGCSSDASTSAAGTSLSTSLASAVTTSKVTEIHTSNSTSPSGAPAAGQVVGGSQTVGTQGYIVAIIEDDESVRRSLELNFELEGYTVVSACDGEEGIELVNRHNPDIIILDVMMPKKDGLQTCKELRSAGISTPLILLTARSAEVDKVLGLELGADDYLAKPFGMRELMARVKALLRRLAQSRDIDTVEFSDVVVDFKAYRAHRNEQQLELSAREYRLLKYLVAKSGAVVTRDELLDEVWGYNSYPSTRTVDNHIARLRQKIEQDVAEPRHIITVHGVGYKFVA